MNPNTSQQIRVAGGLIWNMRSGANFARSYFVYHVDFGTPTGGTGIIASGGSATQSVTTMSDSHFLCHALALTVIDPTAGTVITTARSRIQINDTGAGTNWYDGNIEILNVTGTAQLPALLLPPRLIKPAATLSVTITNDASTNSQFYQLAFVGEKIFDYTGSD